MSTFRLYENGVIYMYHWLTPKKPLKVSTGLKIDPAKWNPGKMRPKSPNIQYKGKNITRELIKHEEALHEALNYFSNNPGFSAMKLKERYKRNLTSENIQPLNADDTSFLKYYANKAEQYKVSGKSNYKGYFTTLGHLRKYFGKERPEFEDINTAFYLGYNTYLLKQGLSTNTISNHWKYLKAMMKQALYEKKHNNTDYQFFKRNKENSDTTYLSIDELKKIFDLNLSGYLDKARDYFLIGAYTGLRFADWDQITKAKIKDGQAIIRNSKTGVKSVIPISPNVERILNKYENGILPRKTSNQRMNDYVKLVAKKADIDCLIDVGITKGGKRITERKPKYECITTHTARRSFATNMVLNGVPPHVIMMVTGHKSLISFEKYVRFDEIQASIQLKESASFKNSFGEALTWSEKLKSDPEFRKEKTKLLL